MSLPLMTSLPARRIIPQLLIPSKNGDYRNLEWGLDILLVHMEPFYLCDCHKLQRRRQQYMAQPRGEIRCATICLRYDGNNGRIDTSAWLKIFIRIQYSKIRENPSPLISLSLNFIYKFTLSHAVNKSHDHKNWMEIELLSGIFSPCEWMPRF